MTGNLNEALVQREVVADRVLPALLVLAVVWEVLHDEFVYTVEGKALFRALTDRHHDESVVAIRRFLILFLLAVRLVAIRSHVLFVFVGAAVQGGRSVATRHIQVTLTVRAAHIRAAMRQSGAHIGATMRQIRAHVWVTMRQTGAHVGAWSPRSHCGFRQNGADTERRFERRAGHY